MNQDRIGYNWIPTSLDAGPKFDPNQIGYRLNWPNMIYDMI